MSTRAINSSILLLSLSYGGFYLGHLVAVQGLIMLDFLHALYFFPPSLSRTIVDYIFHVLCSTMPRKIGNPWRGPNYYIWFYRHKCLGPISLSLIPSGISGHSPSYDKNWHEAAQSDPHPSNNEGLQGGCLLEEEIPPNWEEILSFFQQPPQNNDQPLVSPPLWFSRRQKRQDASWKRESLFRRTTLVRIFLLL